MSRLRPRRLRPHLLGPSLVLLSACAGVAVVPIPDDDADREARGFRYYESSPYVLVYSDGGAGLTSELVYLPDTTRKMSIRPHQVLSSNETKLTFENGVLVGSSVKADSAAVPKAIVEAVKSVALAATKAAFDEATAKGSGWGTEVFPPRLYKLVVAGSETRLIGGSALGPDGEPVVIRVDVP